MEIVEKRFCDLPLTRGIIHVAHLWSLARIGAMSKKRVQQQFGISAADYATSKVHAKGASLGRLVELVQPQAAWHMLDVATAAGHTALAFAPHIAHVTATDITAEMLPVAGKLAAERNISNITLQTADAEALPFPDAHFHLVTCRIAAHHFPHVDRFMAEAARVLQPGGILAVVDNIVPGSRLRGKKGRRQKEAGEYVNAFEKLRDPSHHRCLSLPQWQDAFATAGVSLAHQELMSKAMEFESWVQRMRVSPQNRIRLRAMLHQAPQAVLEFLTPQFTGDRITFRLTEGIFIGRLKRRE